MKRLMLTHAFESVKNVLFHIGEMNFRSRRAVEKIGARLTGHFERPGSDGKTQKVLLYLLEYEDFPGKFPKNG